MSTSRGNVADKSSHLFRRKKNLGVLDLFALSDAANTALASITFQNRKNNNVVSKGLYKTRNFEFTLNNYLMRLLDEDGKIVYDVLGNIESKTDVAEKIPVIGRLSYDAATRRVVFTKVTNKTYINSRVIDPNNMSEQENKFLFSAIYASLEENPEKVYFQEGISIINLTNGEEKIRLFLNLKMGILWRPSDQELRFYNADSSLAVENPVKDISYKTTKLRGRIEIENQEIGKGQFGSVIRTNTGIPQSDGQFVLKKLNINGEAANILAERAVKVTDIAFGDDPEVNKTKVADFFAQADREVNLTQHRFEIGMKNSINLLFDKFAQSFTVMHLMKGKDLVDVGELSTDEALLVTLLTLYDAEKMHLSGIIHRDLKPDNIMVNMNDLTKVRIVDYGLSKLLHEVLKNESSGTPNFISPEAYLGNTTTEASDIYAIMKILAILLGADFPGVDFNNPYEYVNSATFLEDLNFFNLQKVFIEAGTDVSEHHQNILMKLLRSALYDAAQARPTVSDCIDVILQTIVERRMADFTSVSSTEIIRFVQGLRSFRNTLINPLKDKHIDLDALKNQLTNQLNTTNAFLSIRLFVELSGIECLQQCNNRDEVINQVLTITKQHQEISSQFKDLVHRLKECTKLLNPIMDSCDFSKSLKLQNRAINLNRVQKNILKHCNKIQPLTLDAITKYNHVLQKDCAKFKPLLEQFEADVLAFAKEACKNPDNKLDKSRANAFFRMFPKQTKQAISSSSIVNLAPKAL